MFQSSPHIVARIAATYHANRRPDDAPRDSDRIRKVIEFCGFADKDRADDLAYFGARRPHVSQRVAVSLGIL